MIDSDLAADRAAADAVDAGAAARCPYVVVAVVTNNQDPKKLGRVKLEVPVLGRRCRKRMGAHRHADGRRAVRRVLLARGR